MKTKLLFLAFLINAMALAQTYTFSTSTPIPDATNNTGNCGNATNAGSVETSVNVPLTGNIGDPTKITFNLNLTHPWLGDVVAELILPGQTSGCALIKRIGAGTDAACGSQGDFVAGNILSFNSAHTTAIPATGNPATGNYAPTGPNAPSTYPAAIPVCNLSTFLNGADANGDWTLKFYDNGVGDLGTINGWTLVFTPGALDSQEFIINNKIAVMGNPFENELVLNVTDSAARSVKLSLYAHDGKLVNETALPTVSTSENITIDTSRFTSGLYVLIAEVDGQKQTGIKVVKK